MEWMNHQQCIHGIPFRSHTHYNAIIQRASSSHLQAFQTSLDIIFSSSLPSWCSIRFTKHSSFDSFFPSSSSSSCSVSMVALMWLWWLHSLFFDRFNCICACAPIFCSVYSMLQALPSSTNLQFDTSHDGKNAINLQQYAEMNNDNDDNKHNEPHQR